MERRKKVSESRIQQYQIVMPQNLNASGNLFGGQLMAWIDVVAGLVARRFTGGICTTASVDYLSFEKSVPLSSVLALDGCVTYVGNTSMEIRVDTYNESLDGNHILVNRAYLTYVAINEEGRPIRVPRLVTETEEEHREYENGHLRALDRRIRRNKIREIEPNS